MTLLITVKKIKTCKMKSWRGSIVIRSKVVISKVIISIVVVVEKSPFAEVYFISDISQVSYSI